MTEVELLEKIVELLEFIKVYIVDIHAILYFLVTVGFSLLVVYITCRPIFWFLHEY